MSTRYRDMISSETSFMVRAVYDDVWIMGCQAFWCGEDIATLKESVDECDFELALRAYLISEYLDHNENGITEDDDGPSLKYNILDNLIQDSWHRAIHEDDAAMAAWLAHQAELAGQLPAASTSPAPSYLPLQKRS